jgi:16S rRNA (adenine1518-N6/adenine1519-N6)-dimethyltransferase
VTDTAAAGPDPGARTLARGLTPSAVRDLARRHGIRPRKALGQHFLIEPALARRIVGLAGIGPGDHVVEVGPGLGSLTVALAAAGADVVAVEVDPRLVPAVEEAASPWPGRVRVLRADAVTVDWTSALDAPGPWAMVANLPYNVSVPVVLRALEDEPRIERFLVMVQREVGERLAAGAGDRQFGAVSLRVAYFAEARVVRRVARSVFWPLPNVDSVLVLLERRPPPTDADRDRLFSLIRVAFGERRKTMRNALVRFGLSAAHADAVLRASGIEPSARPETLGLAVFARVVQMIDERAPA